MGRKSHHILEDADYEVINDGLVRVVDCRTGKEGIFERGARWVSGELKNADLHMICWVIDTAVRHEAMPPQAR
jgi:hypothetical protein